MLSVNLRWQGPFSLTTVEGRQAFSPPAEGGVYLWCVGHEPNHRVSYVGQASNLKDRFNDHITGILGGAYHLYSDDHLLEGKPPKSAYVSGLDNLLSTFLGDYKTYSALAHKNLLAYRFYWATIEGDKSTRCCVESALIKRCQDLVEPLQNAGVSISPMSCLKTQVASSFATGPGPAAIRSPITYGEL